MRKRGNDVSDEKNNKAIKYVNLTIAGIISLISCFNVYPVKAHEFKTEVEVSQVSKKKLRFTDVPQNFWAYREIEWAANQKIIDGYVDKTFRPNETLTEEQFVSMVNLFFKDLGNDTKVENAYSELAKYQVPLIGYTDKYYRDHPITRGLMAQSLSYLLGEETNLDNALRFMYQSGIMVENKEKTNINLKYKEHVTRADAVMVFYRLNALKKTTISEQMKSNMVSDSTEGAIEGFDRVDDRVIEPKSITVMKFNKQLQFVTTATVPMMSTASTQDIELLRVPFGQKVSSNLKRDDWYEVKVSGKTGYIHSRYLKKYTVKVKTQKISEKMFRAREATPLYLSYSNTSKRVSTVYKEFLVYSDEKYKGWYKVTYFGKTGWVNGKFLKTYSNQKDYAVVAKKIYKTYKVDIFSQRPNFFGTLTKHVDHSFGDKELYITYAGTEKYDKKSLKIGVEVIAKLAGVRASELYKAVQKTKTFENKYFKNVSISNGGDEVLLGF